MARQTDLVVIAVTCPDREVAGRIAAAAIEARLAACAHVGPSVESTYLWRGRVEAAEETLLTLTTRAALFEAVAALARRLHPYEVPAVTAVSLTDATPDYAAWVAAETATEG